MSDDVEATIVHDLENLGVIVEDGLVADPDDETVFYAFVFISTNERGQQSPSKHQLSRASKALEAKGFYVNYILLEGDDEAVEASVKVALEKRFPEEINNVFVNDKRTGFEVWVEPRKQLDESRYSEIENVISELLDLMNISKSRIFFTSTATLPTPTACLTAIRLLAPATLDAIIGNLNKRGLSVPSEQWMKRMLDRLRRSGRITRLTNGTYVLTLNSLAILGSGKGRHSPDVKRALELARRGD